MSAQTDGSLPTVSGEEDNCTAGDNRTCECSGKHQQEENGTQVCASDGSSWGPCDCLQYTPKNSDQPECHNMECNDADNVTLHIEVPDWNSSEDVTSNPNQLFAFWYKADDWSFPQARPPDGGTWTNQIIDPGSPPYTMEVPGCTYYQERLLSGDYYLMVVLQQDPKFPPIPTGKDYWWGWDQNSTHFPFNSSEHQGTTVDMNITLSSVSECNNICGPPPVDSNVITCRYKSIYTVDNCMDFPVSEGWDTGSAGTFCSSQDGFDGSLEVTTGGGNQLSCCQRGMSFCKSMCCGTRR